MTTINPLTGREIKLNGPTHKDLIARKILKKNQTGGKSQVPPPLPAWPPSKSKSKSVIGTNQCEYCNNMFAVDKALPAYQQQYHNCQALNSCIKSTTKQYDEPINLCQRSAQGIFQALVNDIGIRPWSQLRDNVNNYWGRRLLTPRDREDCFDIINEFSERYYRLIENVILNNYAVDMSSGKKFTLDTPADWSSAIRILYLTLERAKQALQITLESKAGNVEGRKTKCKSLKPETCGYPCEVTSSFFGGKKCDYTQKYQMNKIVS